MVHRNANDRNPTRNLNLTVFQKNVVHVPCSLQPFKRSLSSWLPLFFLPITTIQGKSLLPTFSHLHSLLVRRYHIHCLFHSVASLTSPSLLPPVFIQFHTKTVTSTYSKYKQNILLIHNYYYNGKILTVK